MNIRCTNDFLTSNELSHLAERTPIVILEREGAVEAAIGDAQAVIFDLGRKLVVSDDRRLVVRRKQMLSRTFFVPSEWTVDDSYVLLLREGPPAALPSSRKMEESIGALVRKSNDLNGG